MKNFIIISGVILVAIVLYYVYQAGKFAQFVVRFSEAAIKKFKYNEFAGWIKLSITNPSKVSVYIDSYAGEILLDNVKIGEFSGKPNKIIQAKSDTTIQIDFSVNPLNLISITAIQKILEKPGLIVTYKGSATIKGVGVNVKIPFNYSDDLKNLI